MGSGGLFFDFDEDGWIDIFIVDGGSVADPKVAATARHRLYRNRGNGTFEDVTAQSGIRHREYGMGACAGDYDNDGLVDLYVTNFGPNTLYRNMGHGRFTEVPNAGGAGDGAVEHELRVHRRRSRRLSRPLRHQLRQGGQNATTSSAGSAAR